MAFSHRLDLHHLVGLYHQAYEQGGFEGLENHSRASRQHWNKIPESVRDQVVEIALDQTEMTPRELAWYITDTRDYFISESSVYRILKAHGGCQVFCVTCSLCFFVEPAKRGIGAGSMPGPMPLSPLG